jgi:hypothetical protein
VPAELTQFSWIVRLLHDSAGVGNHDYDPQRNFLVPVRGYEKWCSAENVEFVGIAA